MFTSIQLILLIVIFFGLSRVLLRTREKVISAKVSAFWILIWGSAIFIIILPGTTSLIAEYLGVGRGVDIIVYLSLAILFYLVFRMYVLLENSRREMTDLIRQIALLSPKRKKSTKK